MPFLALTEFMVSAGTVEEVAVAETLLGVATQYNVLVKHCNILIIGNGGDSVTIPKSYTITGFSHSFRLQ
jgi:hypothetical protein